VGYALRFFILRTHLSPLLVSLPFPLFFYGENEEKTFIVNRIFFLLFSPTFMSGNELSKTNIKSAKAGRLKIDRQFIGGKEKIRTNLSPARDG